MTQEEFAKMLALTRRQVAEIEAGTANPTLETLEKMAVYSALGWVSCRGR